jgi:hypothetical protein
VRFSRTAEVEPGAGSGACVGPWGSSYLDEDRHFHPDMEKAIAMVRDGRLAKAAGAVTLPAVA